MANMRILWFTPTPSLYGNDEHDYYGGGWISSLERIIATREDIELGISFYHKEDNTKVVKNGTTYYPIKIMRKRNNPIRGLIDSWRGIIDHGNLKKEYLAIIKDFRPDVIHIFGTENPYAEVCQIINIPVIIQTQGLINPIVNAYYPVNQSKWSFLMGLSLLVNHVFARSPGFVLKKYRNIARREKEYLSSARYVVGRTHWDKMVVKLYNPNIKCFHVDEVLRPGFYEAKSNGKSEKKTKFHIVSTLSPTMYKGIDVVLKTAKQLKDLTDIDFQWDIIGLDRNTPLLKHFEKTEKIKCQEAQIVCHGTKGPDDLIRLVQKADVYVHPSYIDNSPNSVCEAQMLGVPVIACDVGGVSSLIEHLVSGILVPSNGIFELVYYLKLLKEDLELSLKIGKQGKLVANKRHSRKKITSDILEIYTEIKN